MSKSKEVKKLTDFVFKNREDGYRADDLMDEFTLRNHIIPELFRGTWHIQFDSVNLGFTCELFEKDHRGRPVECHIMIEKYNLTLTILINNNPHGIAMDSEQFVIIDEVQIRQFIKFLFEEAVIHSEHLCNFKP